LVLRGREILSNATHEKNDEARQLFQHAIDLDPNYAAAYVALGDLISRPSYPDGRNFAVKSLNAPRRSRKRR
jgi:hypothetical protein